MEHSSRELKVGDVVMVLDRLIPESGNPTLGIVEKIVSTGTQRTFKILYNKKSARVDPTSFEIIRSSKKSSFLRPKQGLVYITSPTEDGTIIDVDPLMLDMDESQQQNQTETPEEDDDDLAGVNGDVHNLPQNDDIPVEEEPDDGYQDEVSVNVQLDDDIPLMTDIRGQSSKQQQPKKKVKVSVPSNSTKKIKDLSSGTVPSK